MSWRDNLRPASFRGVSFHVDAHDTSGGRRVVEHEFPLRDTPYNEDMGRRAKRFSVEAFVVGDDYMRARDALMRACDEPGPGELIHPYLGTLQVVCTGWSLQENKSEGRMARFSLSFVESGEAEFPSSATDYAARADMAADLAKNAAIADFARVFSINGMPDFAVHDAIAVFEFAADAVRAAVGVVNSIKSGGINGIVTRFVGMVADNIGFPTRLATSFFSLVESVSSLFESDDSISSPSYRATRSMLALSRFDGGALTPIQTTTSTRRAQQANRDAIIGLVRQAAIIEAARQAPSADYETLTDATDVRDAIAGVIDAIQEDPATVDETFAALTELRTVVIGGVPPVGEQLPDIATITPTVTIPSLVLAYDVHGDASREPEIVARNRLRYPGFVPGAQPIQIIADA